MLSRAQTVRRLEAEALGALIARARRRVYSEAVRALEARGESILVWQVLNRVRREGPLTQCELAFQTAQHQARISRILESLEREGLVRRQRDSKDRRRRRVALTPKAHRRLAKADPQLAEVSDRLFAPLTAAERRALARLLAKFLGEKRR